jgi:hypothetical protein
MALSDEEGDSTRYPWKAKQPPWMKKPIEKGILDDDEE